MPSHYFDEAPSGEMKTKDITVSLDGREVTVTTAGAIFSPDHVDTGTKILLEQLDEAPAGGDILDIGCGWGPIALALAMHSPKATIWAIDVNEWARKLTELNAAKLGLTNIKVCAPDDVPADIEFTGIWSNPPIRVGKEVLHEILQDWLPRLESGAEAYLVVQKNLGADSLQRWIAATIDEIEIERVDTAKAFRVLRATKA
ncbi:MAG: methyltransferase [Rhodoluna sp.]|nr:methyltransferase [Rhodoluna sp.]